MVPIDQKAAGGIAYANGINHNPEKSLLFVASPRRFLIKVYQVLPDNSLQFIEDIHCKTGIDNLEWDNEENLWTAGHPNLKIRGLCERNVGHLPF